MNLLEKLRYEAIFFSVLFLTFIVFPLILGIHIPKEIGLAARYHFIPVFLFVFVFFYVMDKFSGRPRSILTLFLSLTLFALTLSGLWMGGASELSNIGGLLPFSDAISYYLAGVRFNYGELMVGINGRPLYPLVLATFLGFTSMNLQNAIALIFLFNAIVCYFAAREVHRTHGWIAGALMFLLLFLFIRRFSGTTLTENIGFPLGVFGFAAIWRGIRLSRMFFIWTGLFFVALGLNARAGAFFILPALIIWGVIRYRGNAALFKERCLWGALVAVILAFSMNSFHFKTNVSPSEAAFSNGPQVIYGMINGGNWREIFRHHPEINNLPQIERNRKMYALIWESLKTNPAGIIKGSIRAWAASRLFSFVIPFYPDQAVLRRDFRKKGVSSLGPAFAKRPYHVVNFGAQEIFYWAVNAFLLVSIFVCLKNRGGAHHSLILWGFLGIFVSIPFIPPWDADDMRVYAATIPFLAVMPAIAVAAMTRSQLEFFPDPENQDENRGNISFFLLGLGIIVLVFAGPGLTKAYSRPKPVWNTKCQNGTAPYAVIYYPGSYITLIEKNALPKSKGLNIKIDDFKKEMSAFKTARSREAKTLSALNAGYTVALAAPFHENLGAYIAFPDDNFPKVEGLVSFCGKVKLEKNGFIILDSIYSPAVKN